MTLGYSLGTIAFPFATMYFGHAPATFFLFATFYLLRQEEAQTWRPLLAGFCAGWAILVDFAAAVGLIVLVAYALRRTIRRPWNAGPGMRSLLWIVVGAFPPMVALAAYNWVSFGGPFSVGYAHVASSGFAAGQSQGVLGVTAPKLSSIVDLLVGQRGLLRLSPWLVFAPFGIWAARRPGLRWEVGVCVSMVGAYVVVNGGYYLPFGGATPGPRFLTPMLPFAAVLVALAPSVVRPVAAAIIVPSIALTTIATATMPNAVEGVADPLHDLWLPRLYGHFLVENTGWLRWGLPGALPFAALGLAAACAAVGARATISSATAVKRLGMAACGVLTALVLSLGTPLDVPSTLGLNRLVSVLDGGDNGVGVTIVDSGGTGVLTSDGQRSIRPWAELQSRDTGPSDTRVVFIVTDSTGKSVFDVHYGHVSWGSHQRRMLAVEWSLADVEAGVYSLTVAVTSDDGRTTYATVTGADEFTIHQGRPSSRIPRMISTRP